LTISLLDYALIVLNGSTLARYQVKVCSDGINFERIYTAIF